MAYSEYPPSVRSKQNNGLPLHKIEQPSNRTSNNSHWQDFPHERHLQVTNQRVETSVTMKTDGCFRVIYKKNSRTANKKESQPWHDVCNMDRKRIIFGEIEYLKQKLGYSMPSVEETLASERWRRKQRNSHGFLSLNKHRSQTIQRVFTEDSLSHPDHYFNQKNKFNQKNITQDAGLPKNKTATRFFEAKQYIMFLDANSRKSKQLGDKTKFAATKEMIALENKNQVIEELDEHDKEVLQETKNFIEREKKKQNSKRLRDIERKREKIMARKDDNSSDSDESYNHSKEQTPHIKFF